MSQFRLIIRYKKYIVRRPEMSNPSIKKKEKELTEGKKN